MDSNQDWRHDLDDEGFPTANEDRVGDVFIDEYGIAWTCIFVPGLGYGWKGLDDTNTYDGTE